MKPSPADEVRAMYDKTANDYAQMMDTEIALPVYADVLGRLPGRIQNIEGPLVDTACGSGHMLSLYRESYEGDRPLIGVDLSSKMVSIAREKLASAAQLVVGDMRHLPELATGSCAAVLNYFALHHLNPEDAQQAMDALYLEAGKLA